MRSLSGHPIARAAALEMNFSVNTDDPGPFGCSIQSEYELLQETFDFTDRQFELILNNSLRSSFADKGIGR